MARYVNVNRNENEYSPEQWSQIAAQMPRRMWGVRVMTVASEAHGYGYRYPHWWQRAVNWWAAL